MFIYSFMFNIACCYNISIGPTSKTTPMNLFPRGIATFDPGGSLSPLWNRSAKVKTDNTNMATWMFFSKHWT